MKYNHFLSTLVSSFAILSVVSFPLHARAVSCDEDCRQDPPDYVYYGQEESQCIGVNRTAVIAASAIVAGVVIGGVAISLASKHHKGSDSANYSDISKEIDGYSKDRYHSSFGDFSSDFDSNYSRDNSDHHHHDNEGITIVNNDVVKEDLVKSKTRRQIKEEQALTFSLSVEGIKEKTMIVPYVEGPEGFVLEGKALTLVGSTILPEMTVCNPVKGTYYAGVKVMNHTSTTLKTSIQVADSAQGKTVQLDSAGIFEY